MKFPQRAGWVVLGCALSNSAAGSPASTLAKQARQAEKEGEIPQAFQLYSQASLLKPGKRAYRKKADELRTSAALAAPAVTTKSDQTESEQEDPIPTERYFDNITARELAAGGELLPAPQLKGRPGVFDLNFEGDRKSLFQQVASFYKIEVIFDSEFEPGRPFRFRLDQADYRDALHALEAATDAFVVPVAPKLLLVARDTPQKRNDLEQFVTVTVPVPQVLTSQELIEIAQTVRQVMGVEKLGWDDKTSSIVMRDRLSRVLPARALLHTLLAYRSEVMVELQLIEVRKSDAVNYGINLPNAFNIIFTGQGTSGSSTTGTLPPNTPNPFPFNSRSFAFIATAVGGGSGSMVQNVFRGLFPTSLSLWSIAIPEATALANFSRSFGRTIITTNLRASDAQAASFHFGDKYPILTGSYAVGTSVGAQYVPPPSFTFEDLGVTLKVTPHVHGMGNVTLDLESEFKILSGASANGNPIISARQLKSSVDLREQEWAVVAGLTMSSDSRINAGTAGLSRVPLIGRVFQTHHNQKDKSEILILMKPRLLDLPGNQTVTKELWVGTETRPLTPL